MKFIRQKPKTSSDTPSAGDKTYAMMSYSKLVIMTIVTLTIAWFSWFLYSDFYQTIIQAQTVLILKQEVAMKDIEKNLFDHAHQTHEYKRSQAVEFPIPDPFNTASAAPQKETASPKPDSIDNAQDATDKLDELRSSVFE